MGANSTKGSCTSCESDVWNSWNAVFSAAATTPPSSTSTAPPPRSSSQSAITEAVGENIKSFNPKKRISRNTNLSQSASIIPDDVRNVALSSDNNEYMDSCISNRDNSNRDSNNSNRDSNSNTTNNNDNNDSKDDSYLPLELAKIYKIGALLGIGTTSKVFQIQHRQRKKTILTNGMYSHLAVKVIDKRKMGLGMEKVDKEILYRQLRREVEVLKQLSHPNVVSFYDFMETKNRLFIIMEYLSGGELFDYIINSGSLSEDVCQYLFRDLLEAVSYLHDRGVIHRDIKAENLIFYKKLNGEFTLKLIDFGFSTVLRHTLAGSFLGTRGYIAPEMLQNKNYSTSVDVWAVGVVLYCALSCNMPFDASVECVSRNSVEAGKSFALKFPEKRWSHVSDSCKDLLRKLLDFDPFSRISARQSLQHKWFKGMRRLSFKLDMGESKCTELPTLYSPLRSSLSTSRLDQRISSRGIFPATTTPSPPTNTTTAHAHAHAHATSADVQQQQQGKDNNNNNNNNNNNINNKEKDQSGSRRSSKTTTEMSSNMSSNSDSGDGDGDRDSGSMRSTINSSEREGEDNTEGEGEEEEDDYHYRPFPAMSSPSAAQSPPSPPPTLVYIEASDISNGIASELVAEAFRGLTANDVSSLRLSKSRSFVLENDDGVGGVGIGGVGMSLVSSRSNSGNSKVGESGSHFSRSGDKDSNSSSFGSGGDGGANTAIIWSSCDILHHPRAGHLMCSNVVPLHKYCIQ